MKESDWKSSLSNRTHLHFVLIGTHQRGVARIYPTHKLKDKEMNGLNKRDKDYL